MKPRHGGTLIEMLTTVAVVGILVVVSADFLVDGMRAVAHTEQRAETNRLIYSLSDFWQNVLRGSDPGSWDGGGTAFFTDTVGVQFEENALVVRHEGTERRVALPSSFAVAFEVERHQNLADCAVMHLSWTSWYLARATTNEVRLVACGKGRHAPKS